MGIKEKVKENPKRYKWIFSVYNRILGGNKIKIKGKSKLLVDSGLVRGSRIEILGDGNEIIIESLTQIKNSRIFVKGNNNKIIIRKNNGFDSSSLWVEDDGNEILIDEHNRFFENSHLAAIEGTKISIGRDGLFAPGVQIRTGDSHSVMDMEGNRTNKSQDVSIGNHVWIASEAVVLKGSVIPDDVVIGIRSMVNKVLDESNCIYAGTPAKKIKQGVQWNSQRIIN